MQGLTKLIYFHYWSSFMSKIWQNADRIMTTANDYYRSVQISTLIYVNLVKIFTSMLFESCFNIQNLSKCTCIVLSSHIFLHESFLEGNIILSHSPEPNVTYRLVSCAECIIVPLRLDIAPFPRSTVYQCLKTLLLYGIWKSMTFVQIAYCKYSKGKK